MRMRIKQKNKRGKRGVNLSSGRSNTASVLRPPVVRYTPDVFGFPDRLLTRLRYSDTLSMSSATGSIASYVFRWNSTFDPDQTGTGHQPLYRDVYAGIYDNYAVVTALARIRFVNTSTSPFFISVNVQDTSTPAALVQSMAEQSHGLSRLLTPLSGSKSDHEYVIPWSAAKYLNIDAFTSEYYKSLVGANPSNESFLSINAATADSSTALITFQIILEQEVLWSELSTQAEN